jgi:hypothetical protein
MNQDLHVCCVRATKQHFLPAEEEKTTVLLAAPARVWIIDHVPSMPLRVQHITVQDSSAEL